MESNARSQPAHSHAWPVRERDEALGVCSGAVATATGLCDGGGCCCIVVVTTVGVFRAAGRRDLAGRERDARGEPTEVQLSGVDGVEGRARPAGELTGKEGESGPQMTATSFGPIPGGVAT